MLMRYPCGMKKPRQIALEWGLTHRLLDALGVGKHDATLHVRIHRLLHQLAGRMRQVPPPPGDKLIPFDDEPTECPPGMGKAPPRKPKKKGR